MNDCKYKMSIGRTMKTGIISVKELNTDEVYEVITSYEKEIEQLKKVLDSDFDERDTAKEQLRKVKNILEEYDDFEDFVDIAMAMDYIERIARAVGMELS